MPAALARGTMRKGGNKDRSAKRSRPQPALQTRVQQPAFTASSGIPSSRNQSEHSGRMSSTTTPSHLRYGTAATAGRAAIANQQPPTQAPASAERRPLPPPPPINTTLRPHRRQPRNAPPSSFHFGFGKARPAPSPQATQYRDWEAERNHNVQITAAVLDLNNASSKSKPSRSASFTFGRSLWKSNATSQPQTAPAPVRVKGRAMSDSAAVPLSVLQRTYEQPEPAVSKREWLAKEIAGPFAHVRDYWRRHEEKRAARVEAQARPEIRHVSRDVLGGRATPVAAAAAAAAAAAGSAASTPRRRFSFKLGRRLSMGYGERKPTDPMQDQNGLRVGSRSQRPAHLRSGDDSTHYWDHDHRIFQGEGAVMVERSRNNSTVTNFGDLMHRAMDTTQPPPPVPPKERPTPRSKVAPVRPPRPTTPDLPLRRTSIQSSTYTRGSTETCRSSKPFPHNRGSTDTIRPSTRSSHHSKLSSTLQGAHDLFLRRSNSSFESKPSINGLSSPMSIACAGLDTVTLTQASFSPVHPRVESPSCGVRSPSSACGNCGQRAVALFGGLCGPCGGKNRFFATKPDARWSRVSSLYGGASTQNFTRESLVPGPLRVNSSSPPRRSTNTAERVPNSLLTFRERLAEHASSVYLDCPEQTPPTVSPVASVPRASTYRDLGNPFESDLGFRPTPPPLRRSTRQAASEGRVSKPQQRNHSSKSRGSGSGNHKVITGLGISGVPGLAGTTVTPEMSRAGVKRKPLQQGKRTDHASHSYPPPPTTEDDKYEDGARDTKFYDFYKSLFNGWKSPAGTPDLGKKSER